MTSPLYAVRKELVPPVGRDFFTDPQQLNGKPIFFTGEVAKIFFGRSGRWLQKHIQHGNHRHPEYRVGIPRLSNEHMLFQLHHIEVISHALFMRGIISLKQFENSIVITKAIANNHGLMKGDVWSGR